ncbi:MAG TPA: YegP family protein, partial [Burkholderiaceae bacterium]|nr:YegP family protein [Burkholderiaceae bacterium]
ILSSETYKARASAINGVESVKKNAPQTHRFALHTSSNGRHYFTLKAANGQIIGTSQMYATPDSARQGMLSCQTHAPEAVLEDLTR